VFCLWKDQITNILNVLIEKEMEEVKLTFDKRKGKMLKKKMQKLGYP
jgi:hypothetical protein